MPKHIDLIFRGHIWIKTTPSWQGDSPAGTLVKVIKVKKHKVWYKNLSTKEICYLNEWSFRQIFSLKEGFKIWGIEHNPIINPFFPPDYSLLKLGSNV